MMVNNQGVLDQSATYKLLQITRILNVVILILFLVFLIMYFNGALEKWKYTFLGLTILANFLGIISIVVGKKRREFRKDQKSAQVVSALLGSAALMTITMVLLTIGF